MHGRAPRPRDAPRAPCYPPAVHATAGPVLELSDVALAVPAGGSVRRILDVESLRLAPGERLSLVGRSGSGKSTLLRLCNRLLEPTAGTIRFRGRELAAYDPGPLRRSVGLVPQEPIWLPGDARSNLVAARDLGLVEEEAVEERLAGAMELAGIDADWMGRGEDQLSLGQRQRIALGRVLFNRPEVVLLDEPSSALDPPAARALIQQLRRLGEQGRIAMIMVTHRLDDARRFGTRTAVLESGRIVADGPTAEVLDGLETRWDGEAREVGGAS